MRKVLLLAAAAIMVPGAVSAQSTADQANQPNSSTTTNAQSGMGDTANPMASDTHNGQGSTMSSGTASGGTTSDSAAGDSTSTAADAGAATGSSTMGATTAGSSSDMSASAGTDAASPSAAMNKTYPTCSRTLKDSCRNRGGK